MKKQGCNQLLSSEARERISACFIELIPTCISESWTISKHAQKSAAHM